MQCFSLQLLTKPFTPTHDNSKNFEFLRKNLLLSDGKYYKKETKKNYYKNAIQSEIKRKLYDKWNCWRFYIISLITIRFLRLALSSPSCPRPWSFFFSIAKLFRAAIYEYNFLLMKVKWDSLWVSLLCISMKQKRRFQLKLASFF